MLIKILKSLRLFLRKKTGKQLGPYPNLYMQNRKKIITFFKINVIIDVGANKGGYAKDLLEIDFKGRIISFEPLSEAFKELKKKSEKVKTWAIYNFALGNENFESIINIAGNSLSSSLLPMLPSCVESAPESKYIAEEVIQVKTLDSLFPTIVNKNEIVMLKIDTQGYEKYVLEGSELSLESISVIQIEMSIVPLYRDSILFIEMIEYLSAKGFTLFSMENVFSNPENGQLLQVDGIFVKSNLMKM